MKDPLEHQARAHVAALVALAALALGVGTAVILLLDRLGAPARLVIAGPPAFALAAFVLTGLTFRAVRASSFFAAERGAPGLALAFALSTLAFALVPGLAASTSWADGGAPAFVGLIAGFCLLVAGAALMVRKSGAYSLASLFAARFSSDRVRFAVTVAVAVVGALVASAGFEGAALWIRDLLGFSRFAAALLCGFALMTLVVPGGLSGVVWGAAGGGILMVFALVVPLALVAAGFSRPLGDGLDALQAAAAARVDLWAGGIGGGWSWIVSTGVALGVAALAPILAPAVAGRRTPVVARAGLMGLLFMGVMLSALLLGAVVAGLAYEAQVAGQRPEALPAFVYALADLRLLTICGEFAGAPRAAAAACAKAAGFSGALGSGHVEIALRALMTRGPDVLGLGPPVAGLVGAGFLAAALALAGAGAYAFAAAAGDELLRRDGRARVTSRRLASTRFAFVALIGALAVSVGADVLELGPSALNLALLVSAAALAPLFALTLWPRAVETDALVAFGTGAGVVLLAVMFGWRDGAFSLPMATAAGCAGFCLALFVGVFGSLRRSVDDTRAGRIFLQSLFHGGEDAIVADRGA